MLDILIKNANEIFTEEGIIKGDVGIKDGKIIGIGHLFSKAEKTIDATNKTVLP
ncbi:MAG: hypothetical protein Q8O03_02830 [Nanoarchaeota archaeon]|nr:hypothetical protein [Nanoarchaeota archaeon]